MGDQKLHQPCGASSLLVARTSEGLWACDPAAEHGQAQQTMLPGGAAAAILHDVLGHPDRALVAWVEEDRRPPGDSSRSQVRVATVTDRDEGVVVHHDAGPLRLAGWWAEDVLAVARGDGASTQPSEMILVPVGDRQDGVPAPLGPGPSAASWVDHASDGRIVMTTHGPRPVTWRQYRGGGAGRIIIHDPRQGRSRTLPGTGNAADAVVLGERVYWIDDLDGAADIWSLALDETGEGPPVRHSTFGGVGATGLRRAADRLVVETLAGAWTLRPSRDMAAGRWRAASSQDGRTIRRFASPGRPETDCPPQPERVLSGPAGQLAVVAAGGVSVPSASGATWHGAEKGQWTVDAAWEDSGRLLTLEHRQGASVVAMGGCDSEAQQVLHVLSSETAVSAERIAHCGGTTIISGEAWGVLALRDESAAQWLDALPTHRRSRTAVSAEGSLVAWTQEDDLQGGSLIVHDLHTAESAVLSVPGTHLWNPVFDAAGDLLLLARRVSTEAGTAAPMEAGMVCRVAAGSPIRDLRSRQVEVIRNEASALHELAVVRGVAWVRGTAGRWSPVQGPQEPTSPGEGAALPGSDVPAVLRPDGRVSVVGHHGRLHEFSVGNFSPARAQVLEQAVRLVRRSADLVGRPDAARLLDDPTWRAEIMEAAEQAVGADELAQVLDAVVGRAGLSHALILRGQGPPESHSFGAVLIARTEAVLGEHAVYLALSDVSVRGWGSVQNLIRRWRSDQPLVLDLRFNEGGQFADALAARLAALLLRSADATVLGRGRRSLLSGPPAAVVLISEYTGSGGEHLAAALRLVPGVMLWGRRTAGAGTGFHHTRSLGRGLRIALPQYRLGGRGRDEIENHGVVPDIFVEADHTAGSHFDDLLLRRVADHLAEATNATAHKGEGESL